jgi:hypothetical protein
MNEDVKKQLDNFIEYLILGWNTELAFEVCYDAVYDVINKEEFLNLCEKEVTKFND